MTSRMGSDTAAMTGVFLGFSDPSQYPVYIDLDPSAGAGPVQVFGAPGTSHRLGEDTDGCDGTSRQDA